ncbi:hypothetical protein GTO10_05905 [Candidatus Saccharibacteria bacterium]|nr:hypothetical protein [Candidatus Saccharibacteria bacterium]
MKLNPSQVTKIETAIRDHCDSRLNGEEGDKSISLFHRLRDAGEEGVRISKKLACRQGAALLDLGIAVWAAGSLVVSMEGVRNLLQR